MSQRRKKRRKGNAGSALAPRGGSLLDRPDTLPDGQVHQEEMFPAAIVRRQRFAGPLPPPALLEEYDQVVPGLAERIVVMAEGEGDHRRRIESRLIRLSEAGLLSGFLLAAASILGGLYLLWNGKTLEGLAPLVLAIAGIVTVLVLQRDAPPPADTTQ
jgi:uncharacterized membrane protein